MNISITLELEVNPGTLETEKAIKEDAKVALEEAALGLGFSYGALKYQVQTADAR